MLGDELSPSFETVLGVATCDSCGGKWACHLWAWGQINRISNCNACDEGVVTWVFPEKSDDDI